MSITSRIRGWLRRKKAPPSTKNPLGPLREFVYLDDVSVYSILASRKGSIAAEFTERQTATLNSELGSALNVGIGGTGTKLDSRLRATEVQGSQVLRKAIIQTTFRELYNIERDSLALRSHVPQTVPELCELSELQRRLDRDGADNTWLIDPEALRRGDLLEVSVELEVDPIFRMVTIIGTFRELVEANQELFGPTVTAQLVEMQSVSRLLEALLVGLVPIRARLLDYMLLACDGHEVLVHRLLLDQLSPDGSIDSHPVFLAGVAQRELFWKDIRRVLFSRAQYTVFGRLGTPGLADTWHPVKVADVLSGLAPKFDEMVGEFSAKAEQALALAAAGQSLSANSEQADETRSDVVMKYVTGLLVHHQEAARSDLVDDIIRNTPLQQHWHRTVDGRRAVFAEVTRRIDRALEVETSGEVAYRLRQHVWLEDARAVRGSPPDAGVQARDELAVPQHGEKFLDTEVIAVYW